MIVAYGEMNLVLPVQRKRDFQQSIQKAQTKKKVGLHKINNNGYQIQLPSQVPTSKSNVFKVVGLKPYKGETASIQVKGKE